MFRKLKDYFIPHEGNGYTPHSLQKAAMFGMLFLIILSFTATNALSLLWISSQWMVGTVLPAVIVSLTNEEREGSALGTLKRSSVLDAAASLKAHDMANNSYFAHYSPAGVSPWHWFGEAGYNFVHAGENLAIHFSDSSAVVDAWMESPTHRANIVNANYTEIGVGTAEGTYEGFPTVYVVQLFGTPAAPVPVAVAPKAVAVEPQATQKVAGAVADTKTSTATQTATQTEAKKKEVLAEAVTITETVKTVKAKPVAIEVAETVATNTATTTASTTPTTVLASTDASGSAPTATHMEATDTGVVLYTDFLSTSTGGIPATVASVGTEKVNKPPFFLSLATQPHKVLQILYVVIGLFVFVSLMLSIFIEIRQQQPLQIAYGVGLMTLMMLLFYVHTIVSGGALIL